MRPQARLRRRAALPSPHAWATPDAHLPRIATGMTAPRFRAALLGCALLLGCASGAQAQPFHPGPKIGPPPPYREMPDPALKAAVDSSVRPAADVARDAFRHPLATLRFWEVRPGATVVDLQPGGGYWTYILAPYAKATHGRYVAAGSLRGKPAFEAKFADAAKFGHIDYVEFGKTSGPLLAPESADVVITSREIHNWIGGGYLDKAMHDAFAALKRGGVFAVEEHRADPKPQLPDASNGYVSVATVKAAAERAGFRFEAASEVNANPRDTKDHPFGVWTLPPTRQSAPGGQPPNPAFDHAKYDAIGESDRMTLRFRKP